MDIARVGGEGVGGITGRRWISALTSDPASGFLDDPREGAYRPEDEASGDSGKESL